jgi:hypothetical protein
MSNAAATTLAQELQRLQDRDGYAIVQSNERLQVGDVCSIPIVYRGQGVYRGQEVICPHVVCGVATVAEWFKQTPINKITALGSFYYKIKAE